MSEKLNDKDIALLREHITRNSDDLARNVAQLQTRQANIKEQLKWWGIGIAFLLTIFVSITGYTFTKITKTNAQIAAIHQHIEDLENDFNFHINHPQLHTNGINNLRDHIDDHFVEKDEHSSIVDQLNRRLKDLEKDIG